MRSSLFLALLATLALVPAADAQRDPADIGVFAASADSLVGALLQSVPEVPGLAFSVVVDDAVALSRGYGAADLEQGIRASGQTLYYIASATKPYTALMAALLHEQGRIDLDSPLAEHLQGSGIHPELIGADVTLRDLLTHTAGLENEPVSTRLAFTGEHTPEELWRLLAATGATEAGPGAYEYDNFGYNLLTLILDRELGERWQELLQQEVFGPAGLARTTTLASRPAERGWPVAAPYFGLHPDGIRRVPLVKTDATMQSAGGILTTSADAARWLLLQIHEGAIDGHQVFDRGLIRETHRSRVTPAGESRGLFGTTGCALGWQLGAWAGQPVLHHSGGYPGFRSLISFMPGARIGVAVFVNEGSIGGPVAEALVAWAYDWWLQTGAADSGATIRRIEQMREQFAERVAADYRQRAARPWLLDLEPAAYAGAYWCEQYGAF